MAEASCTDQEFIALYKANGPAEAARILSVGIRSIYTRRRRLEKMYGSLIQGPSDREPSLTDYPKRIPFKITDGTVVIGSDAHYWPGEASPAHRGIVKLCGELKPKLILLNGDVADGARASRHSRIGWAKTPSMKEELEAIEERTDEIIDSSKGSKFYWLLGNHCMRFETKLSNQAPEFEGIPGFSLKDHFPRWNFGLSLWINEQVVIKHRFKGGIHATQNNTLWAGKSMVTGHLHSLKVTPFSDYNGIRYGIDTGTLADPYGEHADYSEDNPLNHRSGFIVLTFHNGMLLWPEVCRVVDNEHVEFRGEVIPV